MIITRKTTWVLVVALLIFIGLCLAGWRMAADKPLGSEELYTQVSSISGQSYGSMLVGNIPEANVGPLFYLTQKAWEDAVSYQTPQAWVKGQWAYNHPDSDLILRGWSVVFMAGGIAIIFAYFAGCFNIWLGLYSVVMSLGSTMVWVFATHASPYALWFFLTAVQMVLLLNRRLGWLSVVNCLLAFTMVFSIIQQVAVAAVLLLAGERRWRKYIALLAIPIAISVYYYIHSPSYPFWFADSFTDLLGANLPLDRAALILLASAFLAAAVPAITTSWLGRLSTQQWHQWIQASLFTAIIIGGCWLVLMKLQAGQMPNKEGFQVPPQYFMALTPVGIVMATLASYYVAVLPKRPVLRKFAWGLLAVFAGIRLISVFLSLR